MKHLKIKLNDGRIKTIPVWAANELIAKGEAEESTSKAKDAPVEKTKDAPIAKAKAKAKK